MRKYAIKKLTVSDETNFILALNNKELEGYEVVQVLDPVVFNPNIIDTQAQVTQSYTQIRVLFREK